MLDAETRGEWMGLGTTVAFLGTVSNLRAQIAAGVIESIKAGTIDDRQMFCAGGELRALDQLLSIVSRKALRG